MLSHQKRLVAGVALGSALLFTACTGDLVKSISGLTSLRQKLTEKYGDQVTVNLQNSRYLQIIFVNSHLNKQDRAKRIERARETARFVTQNYEDIKSIEAVWVSFLASETRFIVFHYSQGIDSFGFDRNGASLDAQSVRDGTVVSDESEENDVRKPVAQYNQTTNETDISITRIQLEGNINRGVVLVPHFTVTGDVRRSGKVKSRPDFVVFDFAAYADRPIFHDTPALEVFCDDRLALKGEASLVPAREYVNRPIAQFLSAHVSFKLFEQMANSRRVRIVLGPKQFELSPDDISALKQMTAYVPTARK